MAVAGGVVLAGDEVAVAVAVAVEVGVALGRVRFSVITSQGWVCGAVAPGRDSGAVGLRVCFLADKVL